MFLKKRRKVYTINEFVKGWPRVADSKLVTGQTTRLHSCSATVATSRLKRIFTHKMKSLNRRFLLYRLFKICDCWAIILRRLPPPKTLQNY